MIELVVMGAPETFAELKAYTRAHDGSWPASEEFPNPEEASAWCLRRFRHDFTNYDEAMDAAHGNFDESMRVCRDVAILAHLLYPELSPRAIQRFLKKKVKHLTKLEKGM